MKKLYNLTLTLTAILVSCLTAWGQTSEWKPVGPTPFPVNASSQINGIGRVSQLKFDPLNLNRMYAVAPHSVFVSDNLATSWSIMPGTDDFPAGTNLASICIDYTNTNILYLGTGDADYYSASNASGVWKSTDGGQTFALSNTGMGNKLVDDILMSPDDHNVLVASTNAGIYKSTNGGSSWTLTSAVTKITDMCMKAGASTKLFAVSSDNQNFYSSADFGSTWTTTTLGVTPSNGGRVAITSADPNVVYVSYVGSNNTIGGGIVYRSADGGVTFTLKKGDVLPNLNGYSGTTSGQGGYNYDIEADPLDPNILYSCGHLVWKSTDGGANWIQSQTSWGAVLHTDEHQFLFHPNDPNKLFNANDGGVWINTNRVTTNTWVPTSDGLAATEFYNFGNSRSYKNLVGGGTQDNGEVYYKDGAWKTNRGGDFTSKYFFDNASNYAYYGESGKRRDLLNNPTGSDASINLPAVAGNSDQYTASHQNANIAFYANLGSGIFKTINLQSANPVWSALNSFKPTTQPLAMEVSPADANVLYVLSQNKTVMRSTNALGAATFTAAAPAPMPTGQPTNGALAVFRNGVVYMSSDGYVYRSANQGASWAAVGAGPVSTILKSQKIKKMIADTLQASTETVFAYTREGVYYINNTLADWAYVGINLPTTANLNGMELAADPLNPLNSLLRVCTFGRGIWETPARTLVGTAPVVTIISPSSNASFAAGSTITIEATASDADGTVSKVEFYQGNVKIGEDAAAPYSCTWNNVTDGAYAITARVTDDQGNQGVAAPVSVLVNTTVAIADSYVRDGGSATANFGTATGLIVKKDGAGFSREIYLKFDLSSISPDNYAFLRLNIASAGTGISGTTWQVYYVPDDSWTETGINWSNKPAATTLLGTVSGKSSGWAEWNITQQALAELAGDKTLSLKLVSTVLGNTMDVTFNSREASATLSPQLSFRNENTAPAVSITSPAFNASISSTIIINANASDQEGSVTKVEFFEGNNKLGEDLSAPYSFTWNNAPAGSYLLTARATDNAGATADSDPIAILVNTKTATADAYVRDGGDATKNFGTAAGLDLKKDGAGFSREVFLKYDLTGIPTALDTVKLRLNIASSNTATNTTTWQLYYVPDDSWTETNITWNAKPAATTLLGTIQGKSSGWAEWDIKAQALAELAGDKILSLKIVSTVLGGATNVTFTSREIGSVGLRPQITYKVRIAPTVAITSPVNNENFTGGSSVTINANAADADGTVSKVEFFSGATKLGEDLSAPYSFEWNNVAIGSYALTAKATDNSGDVTTSATINVAVNCIGAADIPQANLKVIYFDSQQSSSPAINAIDGNPATIWHSLWSPTVAQLPHEIQLSLGNTYNVNRFKYLPTSNAGNGTVAQYQIYVTLDSLSWGAPVATGTFEKNATEKVVIFPEKPGKFVRFKALSEAAGQQFTSAAELNVGYCSTPPAVAITSPANAVSFNAPATITIAATASDAEGTVDKVEFFQGSTKLGEDLEPPFSFEWTGVLPGVYGFRTKATDNSGLSTMSDSITVIVKDATAPVITCLDSIVVSNDPSQCGAAVNFAVTATDDFSQATVTYSHDPGTIFPVGTTIVTATGTDASGNSSTCLFPVTVKDATAPVITAPEAIVVDNDAGQNGAVVTFTAPAGTDNCTGAVTTQTAGLPSGSFFPVGTTTNTFVVTDGAGNTSNCSFAVTVNDVQAPVVAATQSIVLCHNADSFYSIGDITATDNNVVSSVTYQISGATVRNGNGLNASGRFEVGVSTIAWTVKDQAGNATVAQTTVTVNGPITASIADVYAVNPGGDANTIYLGYYPSSLTLTAQASGGSAPYTYAWSNGATSASAVVNPTAIGVHDFTVTITDARGCATTFTKQVIVRDIRSVGDKVFICHNGTNSSISVNAVQAHLNHGDKLGDCGVNSNSNAIKEPILSSESTPVAYPNPFDKVLNIKLPMATEGQTVNYEIYDVIYNTLLIKSQTTVVSGQINIAQAANLASGQYMIRISVGQQSLAIRIMKSMQW
ncbi:DUF7594 domain-containing protein [Solitalea lacus]|uniref:CBM96 family carbohydrate-binding protein n=1 Tax=Solitalea lacus TaxID=2911172 RepID=UPI001ED9E562|nr:Ig-like domain-containing protein [Solitalea lacus]UKJ06737.1 Ig-like domain-containing protein [Solitalea lacus]